MIQSEGMAMFQSDLGKPGPNFSLPPGYRFHPTDEELVGYHLAHKVANGHSNIKNLAAEAIGVVDFNSCEPWDLEKKAKMDNQSTMFFFSLRDRKYPTGTRTNRATVAGYWKATGKDREVVDRTTGRLLGMKKTLVFYTGRAPKGERTPWIMHEYRLADEPADHQQEWVVCRIFNKSSSSKTQMAAAAGSDAGSSYGASDNTDLTTAERSPLQRDIAELNTSISHFPEPNTLSEQLGYSRENLTSLAGLHGKRSNSSMKWRRADSSYGASDNTELTAAECSSLQPDFAELKSSISYFPESNTLSEQLGYSHDDLNSFAAPHRTGYLKRPNSSMIGRRELGMGEAFEELNENWPVRSSSRPPLTAFDVGPRSST